MSWVWTLSRSLTMFSILFYLLSSFSCSYLLTSLMHTSPVHCVLLHTNVLYELVIYSIFYVVRLSFSLFSFQCPVLYHVLYESAIYSSSFMFFGILYFLFFPFQCSVFPMISRVHLPSICISILSFYANLFLRQTNRFSPRHTLFPVFCFSYVSPVHLPSICISVFFFYVNFLKTNIYTFPRHTFQCCISSSFLLSHALISLYFASLHLPSFFPNFRL